MHLLPAAPAAHCGNAATYSVIAFVISAAIAALPANGNNSTESSSESYFRAINDDKRQQHAGAMHFTPATFLVFAAEEQLIADKNAISLPSNYNDFSHQPPQAEEQPQESLKQQQKHQQHKLVVSSAPIEELSNTSDNNNNLPLDHVPYTLAAETIAEGSIESAVDICAGADGGAGGTSSGNQIINSRQGAAAVSRNGFPDKINISNQRNEFNGQLPQTTTTPKTTNETSYTLRARIRRNTDEITNNNNNGENNANSSFFESVELQAESLSPPKQQHQRQQQLLILQRRKRYLLFPESSSFQMIFDLIIPIIDWTQFALMGITCAVAWELPSKPPSEIIENFREKLNDGTFGYQRRNDTVQLKGGVQYVDVEGGRLPATVAAGASVNGVQNGGAYSTALAGITKYGGNSYTADLLHMTPLKSTRHWWTPSAKQVGHAGFNAYAPFLKYYKSANANGDSAGYVSADNGEFTADWHRRVASKEQQPQADGYYYQHAQFKPHATTHAGVGWRKGMGADWWARNKGRVQQNWRQKQHQWAKYASNTMQKAPVTTYAQPAGRSYQAKVPSKAAYNEGNAKARQILQAPPKHRVYPLFARRRRRRSHNDEDDEHELHTFELKLERIHLREQLQTRQKLYGKIEKLFKVQGHNGTACVLRALCETAAQRAHQFHPNQQPQQQQQRQQQPQELQYEAEPQSFITELLRAIFTLPTVGEGPEGDSMELELMQQHMKAHYREAHAFGARGAMDGSDVGNCAERFGSLCEHSIWS